MPKPLGSYIFTYNKLVEEKFLTEISSGGVSINNVLTHLGNPNLPFGGVGSSGMGSYHGKYSFDTFSHQKSILKTSNKISIPIIFPPYKDKTLNLIRRVFK